MVYRDLCFHLTNDSALVADTAIIGRLKNAEALQQAANSYFLQSDVSSNVLLLFQALTITPNEDDALHVSRYAKSYGF